MDTQASLVSLAAKQLNISPKQVPDAYIYQLRLHRFKNDREADFFLKPYDGLGYGVITCGVCKAKVVLDLNPILEDGGLRDGVGGLAAYVAHCRNTEAHQVIQTSDDNEQDSPIGHGRRAVSTTNTPVKLISTQITPHLLKTDSSSPLTALATPAHFVQMRPLTKKRPSETIITPESRRSAKRVKIERRGHRTPLQSRDVNRETSSPGTPSSRRIKKDDFASPVLDLTVEDFSAYRPLSGAMPSPSNPFVIKKEESTLDDGSTVMCDDQSQDEVVVLAVTRTPLRRRPRVAFGVAEPITQNVNALTTVAVNSEGLKSSGPSSSPYPFIKKEEPVDNGTVGTGSQGHFIGEAASHRTAARDAFSSEQTLGPPEAVRHDPPGHVNAMFGPVQGLLDIDSPPMSHHQPEDRPQAVYPFGIPNAYPPFHPQRYQPYQPYPPAFYAQNLPDTQFAVQQQLNDIQQHVLAQQRQQMTLLAQRNANSPSLTVPASHSLPAAVQAQASISASASRDSSQSDAQTAVGIRTSVTSTSSSGVGRPSSISQTLATHVASGRRASVASMSESVDISLAPGNLEGVVRQEHVRDVYAPARDGLSLDDFIQRAGNAQLFDGDASVIEALAALNLPDQTTKLPHMTVCLLPHQVKGVAWMLARENTNQLGHKGGILADDMGLGKTIQMLATMTINRPGPSAPKGTLIVCPVALLDQWKLEIETKTKQLNWSIHMYHGPNRAKIETLASFDIVLTTYGTLSRDMPSDLVPKKKSREECPIYDDITRGEMGLLLATNWYRVVLDETQTIKNRRTRVTCAAFQLHAHHKWCLTGTPITNSLEDVFPLLKVIGVRQLSDWTYYYPHFVKHERRKGNRCAEKLQGTLQKILLRRRKDQMADGRKLVELPPKVIQTDQLDFCKEERDIYKAVEERQLVIFNKYRREGTVMKNYHHVLTMILRLRQICCHPALAIEILEEPDMQLIDADVQHKAERSRASRTISPQFVAVMQARLLERACERVRQEREYSGAEFEVDCCLICLDQLDDAVIPPCEHTFCKACVLKAFDVPAPEEAGISEDQRPCPRCQAPFSKGHLFALKAFEPTSDEVEQALEDADRQRTADVLALEQSAVSRRPVRKTRNCLPAYLHVPDSDSEDSLDDFIVEDDEDEEEKDARKAAREAARNERQQEMHESVDLKSEPEEMDDDFFDLTIDEIKEPVKREKKGPKDVDDKRALAKMMEKMPRFLPSTKYMMSQLTRLKLEHPSDKIIVISQWTSCLELAAQYLKERGFQFVRYQGNMNKTARSAAVKEFMMEDGKTLMLLSLKAGGVGLNLTRANRVISLDLGWSEAVEAQAFDRVHRLGQDKDVVVKRLVIKETIEDVILEIHARKKGLADVSLGEGTGFKLNKLTVDDLGRLLGER